MAISAPLGNILVAAALLAASGCADNTSFDSRTDTTDGSASPDVSRGDAYVNPCAPNPPPTITGRVFAPNGSDPVARALIGVPTALKPLPKTAECRDCKLHGRFKAFSYGSADGRFELSGVPNDGKPMLLAIERGYFRRVLNVTVPPCGTLELKKEQTTLPGKTAEHHPLDTVPRIAVVTGAWDKLERVLDKIGIRQRTSFDGKTPQFTGPTSAQHLLQNAGLMSSFHMLFINCGTQSEQLVRQPGAVSESLAAYARGGGQLFVTDYSYDFVEKAFPELIDFEGDEEKAPSIPEAQNEAELGHDRVTVNGKDQQIVTRGEVVDASLKSWLAQPEIAALTGDGFDITGWQTGWAVQKSVNARRGKVLVRGNVRFIGGHGVRPLTSTFDVGDDKTPSCGRVSYSSYHTHQQSAVNAKPLPQERVLEYLIFDLGACRGPL